MADKYYKAMRQCYRKSAFREKSTAIKRANKIKYEGGPQLYVYGCTKCGQYHLTKNKDVATVL